MPETDDERERRPRATLVSIDRPWPPRHGGALRTLKLAEALSTVAEVNVAYPDYAEEPAVWDGLRGTPLPWSDPPGYRGRVSRRPRVGVALHEAGAALESLAAASDLVVYSHSYLVPWSPSARPRVRVIVDFANVEVLRQASMAHAGRGLKRIHRLMEAAKARAWEPRVARAADLAIAVTTEDAVWLRDVGANVLHCPNGIDRSPYVASPAGGPVVFIASFGYEPNRLAARWLMDGIWPAVRVSDPSAQLLIVGRQADGLDPRPGLGIEVHADVPSVEPFYRQASVVVAPVTTGGGAQLKIAEALAHHRVVVATAFSSASAPAAAVRDGVCIVADDVRGLAAGIVGLMRDVAERHRLEQVAVAAPMGPTWEQSFAPLRHWISENVREHDAAETR